MKIKLQEILESRNILYTLVLSLFLLSYLVVFLPINSVNAQCEGPREKCRWTGPAVSSPHCFIGDEREYEADCTLADNYDVLTAPNCYLLTHSGPPSGGTYSASPLTCPWGDLGAAGFTDVDFGVDCEPGEENCCVGEDGKGVKLAVGVDCAEGADNVVLAYLVGFINFLAVGVGLVVTAMIVAGGVEYILAGGAPQKLEKAKSLITNALIALVTFIFMYAILQWLIPGGFI